MFTQCVMPSFVPFKPPTFSEAIMLELRKDDITRGYYGKRKETFLKWLEQSRVKKNNIYLFLSNHIPHLTHIRVIGILGTVHADEYAEIRPVVDLEAFCLASLDLSQPFTEFVATVDAPVQDAHVQSILRILSLDKVSYRIHLLKGGWQLFRI